MIQDNLKLSKISDIIFRIDEYLLAMRAMENEDAIQFVDYLDSYVRNYFDSKTIDELELKKILIELADMTYLIAVNLDVRDVHTDG